ATVLLERLPELRERSPSPIRIGCRQHQGAVRVLGDPDDAGDVDARLAERSGNSRQRARLVLELDREPDVQTRHLLIGRWYRAAVDVVLYGAVYTRETAGKLARADTLAMRRALMGVAVRVLAQLLATVEIATVVRYLVVRSWSGLSLLIVAGSAVTLAGLWITWPRARPVAALIAFALAPI